MHVLVTHASRRGATDAVAQLVADRLQARGLTVSVVPVDEVDDTEGYDAVVIGGGTAGAHWLRPARRFVQRHEEELARRPVWLFGSAHPPNGAARPREFDEFHRLVETADEAVFAHADRPRVHAWASEIADRLERLRRDRAIDAVHEMRVEPEMSEGEPGRA